MTNEIELKDSEFRLLSELVKKTAGITLAEHKKALLIQRLRKEVLKNGFHSFKEYYEFVVNDSSGEAISDLVNRISTNHTFFYREPDHFDFFKNTVLPEFKKRFEQTGKTDIRIWCAASSSGEEPYTLAMLVAEYFGIQLNQFDISMLATDISTVVLNKAISGIYEAEQINKLPLNLQKSFFNKKANGMFEVKNSIKQMLDFKRFNLIRPEFPFKKKFHTIFCRNIMIYFDAKTKNELFEKYTPKLFTENLLLLAKLIYKLI